jgi:hypothetical protein
LGLVFLAGLAVRAWFLWFERASPFAAVPIVDAREYHIWASAIASGQGLLAVWAHHSPLYPLFLAGAYKLFGTSPWPVYAVHALLGSLTAALCCAAAWRAWRSGWAAGAAGLAAAFGWPFIYPTGQLLPQTIEIFFAALAFFLLSGPVSSSVVRSLAAGCAAGAVCSLRPQFLPACFVVGAFLSVAWPRRDWKPALAFVIPMLMLSLWWGAYLRAHGIPAFLQTRSGMNLYIANRPGATGLAADYPGLETLVLKQKAAVAGALGPKEDAFFLRLVLDRMRTDPVVFAGLWLKRLGLTLGRCEIPAGEAHPWPVEGTHLVLRRLDFALLLSFGLCGLMLGVRSGDGFLRTASAYAGVGVLALSAAGAAARYRAPLLPVLALGAGCAVLRLREAFASEDRRAVALLASVVIGVGVFSSWTGSLAALDPGREHAIALTLEGRAGGNQGGRGRDFLRAWVPEHPADWDSQWHLGLVLIHDRDWSAANRAFQRLAQARGGDLPQLHGIAAWLSALDGRIAEAAAGAQASCTGDAGSLEACFRAALYAKLADPSMKIEDRLLRCPLDPAHRRPAHPAAEELAAVLLAASQGSLPRVRIDLQEALVGVEEAYWEGWQLDYPAIEVRKLVFRQRWPLTRVGPQIP